MSPDAGVRRAEAHHAATERSSGFLVLCEGIATGLLLIAVVGSGIMAERLSGGNMGLALLANALATGGALFALIVTFGPQSGAHMNPLVTLTAGWAREMPWPRVFAYTLAQIAGAVLGVWLAHLMFELPVLQTSQHVRAGIGQWVAEAIATAGLLLVIGGSRAHGLPVTATAVAAYITGAYWFTASTSFANPAVTLARSLSDSFAGIAPSSAPGFIAAQCVGGLLALPLLSRLRL